MKPKPFSPLNHFTEPVAIENPLLSWPDLTRVAGVMAGSPCGLEGFPNLCRWCPRGGTLARRHRGRGGRPAQRGSVTCCSRGHRAWPRMGLAWGRQLDLTEDEGGSS